MRVEKTYEKGQEEETELVFMVCSTIYYLCDLEMLFSLSVPFAATMTDPSKKVWFKDEMKSCMRGYSSVPGSQSVLNRWWL